MKTEEVVDVFMRLPEDQQRCYLAAMLWFLDARTRLQFEALLNGSAPSLFRSPTLAPAGAAGGVGETAAHVVGSGEAARGSGAKGAPVSPDDNRSEAEVSPGVALRDETGRLRATARRDPAGTEAAASASIPTSSREIRPPERVRTSPAIAEDVAFQNERPLAVREAPVARERMIPLPEGGDRGGREVARSRTEFASVHVDGLESAAVLPLAGALVEAPQAPDAGARLGNTAGLVATSPEVVAPSVTTSLKSSGCKIAPSEKHVASDVADCREFSPSRASYVCRGYFSLEEVAAKLGVSRRTIEREIQARRFPRPFKIRGRSMIRAFDLQTYEWKLKKNPTIGAADGRRKLRSTGERVDYGKGHMTEA